ncbi:glycosyltransferase [Halalkalibacter krulwichiae]|uniref:Glycosyl transferases group 1 n=1 Tax=Halalkalibacter krulwichiae TaxID=199441 RepID=A0A1X9MFI4_9BACI|nr:glycosyltransferase [Halalkalibacter krulwichiae]ARK32217.1 Glycosyl transferases group 1 [Halalkalibacter krulwichiae]
MTNRKKVVHITTVHHPLDPRIYYKECQSLQEAGYDVTLIAPDGKETIKESNVNVVSITKRKNKILRMLLSTVEAYKAAKKQKADFYQIHDPELLPVAWLLKKKDNVVIYDIHEDYETSIMQKDYIKKPMRKLIAKAYRTIEGIFAQKLELCLAEKYYKEKYPRGTCVLNYPILNPEARTARKTKEPVVDEIIYTGNVSVERGALLQARIPVVDPSMSIHFYGKCPKHLAENMLEQAGDYRSQVKIEGIDRYVPKDEIDQAYSSRNWLAGIALFPRDDHYMKKELTKFFEYMSYGLPIICSNFPVWKQFVETHRCGIAVDPTNDTELKAAIEYIRTHPEEAWNMGENGKKSVREQLNWDKEAEKLVQWYQELELAQDQTESFKQRNF